MSKKQEAYNRWVKLQESFSSLSVALRDASVARQNNKRKKLDNIHKNRVNTATSGDIGFDNYGIIISPELQIDNNQTESSFEQDLSSSVQAAESELIAPDGIADIHADVIDIQEEFKDSTEVIPHASVYVDDIIADKEDDLLQTDNQLDEKEVQQEVQEMPEITEDSTQLQADNVSPSSFIDAVEEPKQQPSEVKTLDWMAMLSDIEDVPVPAIETISEKEDDVITDNIMLDQLAFILEETQELVPEVEALLHKLGDGSSKTVSELHRKVHTLKGTVGQAGAMRARAVIHEMETVMEEMDEGKHKPLDKKVQLLDLFATAKALIKELEHVNVNTPSEDGVVSEPVAIQAPKTVRVNAETVDAMVADINESRLSSTAMDEYLSLARFLLKDLDDNGQRAFKMLREFELQAEMQIQSRKTQLQELGEDFDPLELDRFTRFQELSRMMAEAIGDILEDRRELVKVVVDQEATLARQRRALLSTQEKLHKSRLTPFDAINDRLHGVARGAARELGKSVSFEMTGGRVELDRVLLEKILGPLEHILRNSVTHGIENSSDRIKSGKPAEGTISIKVRQDAGRAIIDVIDDGYGLRVSKIRDKAIEKGLWDASQPMDSKQAADIICSSGFSTADSISQLAGRGVGMDVVRSEILGLGGRFDIISEERKGMAISIQLPTSIASASVLVVQSSSELWAFPIEMVEHIIWMQGDALKSSREDKSLVVSNKDLEMWADADFVHLSEILSLPTSVKTEKAPVLLVRERGRVLALEVDRLVQVSDVPLRPPGAVWSGVPGVAGTVIISSGDAVFLIDPFRAATSGSINKKSVQQQVVAAPLVMVVDDSLTVRKATSRFLQKNGYDCVLAKDGQEALEMLVRIQPSVILLDVEMPRLDGFECAKSIREGTRNRDVPIVMITSRTADKHRRHAFEIGVNDYMGKPFKDDELLAVLKKHIKIK